MNQARLVRIGGASGAWGDSPGAIGPLLAAGVDYLMMDYLAEVTMSLLARARLKDPEAGYPPDVVDYLEPHLQDLARRQVKVTTNAGGVNPAACKAALEAACRRQGVALRIAVVEGDDLMPLLHELRAEGVREWSTGAALPEKLLTANAYLGAGPIAAALAAGADIVITGRCVDSALALGILMHEFGWGPQDHDRLAAGSLVGHLLECGPQVTGGVFTDWQDVPAWERIGYPIAECDADGRIVITKPEGSGGLVSTRTVAEQVLYEVGDPAAYMLPDVCADFSHVRLQAVGPDRVQVSGARGRAPSRHYKVSATYQDGWRAVTLVVIVGAQAVGKARRTAQALVARGQDLLKARGLGDFSCVHVEVLGSEASYGSQSRALRAREVVLRLVVEHAQAKALSLFARELGSVGLSFAQGTTGLIGGRPKPVPVVRLFTFLVAKDRLAAPRLQVGEGPAVSLTVAPAQDTEPVTSAPHIAAAEPQVTADAQSAGGTGPDDRHPNRTEDEDCRVSDNEAWVEVPLMQVAHARSGDKGDASNIAIFCRDTAFMPHLDQVLTSERLLRHFADSVRGPVTRYVAPGLHAFNFVLEQALDGGGMASRRIDPQGKAYGQRALEMMIPVPRAWSRAESPDCFFAPPVDIKETPP